MPRAVKNIKGRPRRRAVSIRGRRVETLRERLGVESDPKTREMILAQLRALAPRQDFGE